MQMHIHLVKAERRAVRVLLLLALRHHVLQRAAEYEDDHLVLRGGADSTAGVPQFVDMLVDVPKLIDERIVPFRLLLLRGLLGLPGLKRRRIGGFGRLLPLALPHWRKKWPPRRICTRFYGRAKEHNRKKTRPAADPDRRTRSAELGCSEPKAQIAERNFLTKRLGEAAKVLDLAVGRN